MNLIDLLHKGGPIVWVLAAYSSIGLAIVIERYFLLIRQRRLPQELAHQLNQLLEQPDAWHQIAKLKGPEANVIRAILAADRQGVRDLKSVGDRVTAQERQRLDFGLPTLGILGSTAPLLGLLGTITGMIKAFMVIEAAGGKVDAQALAGGIWEAMVTTGVGLAVAIPLVILLHFLEGSMERRGASMQRCAALLLERRTSSDPQERAAPVQMQWERLTDGL
ncbi:MAG: MotA/TolQ/ExbB proton channel family protein [Chromatiaceae bacterium]|nr:MotA/TolQ/ExbB proton channel family protein [Gammaproteobacteria bacterium]MCP5445721.1 MotA/TolQ/ExbB proton channel family protein [Chromatiaceae bacterium]